MNTKCRYEHQWLTKLNKRRVRAALALLLLLPVAAWAGGVVTNCTEADLRAAMAGGGVVTFACDGTITLANTITNAADTSLDGSGRQVTISGNNTVRVFLVNTNVSFTVVNLTIADGTSLGGSAILNLGGSVNLTGGSFRSNTAALNVTNDYLISWAGGGSIFNRGGTVNADNCSFADNAAQILWATDTTFPVYGGAIRNEAGQVDLRSCAFMGNWAFGGAAILLSSWSGNPALGGAIHNSGTVTLDLCTLTGNSTTGGDGGTAEGFDTTGFPGKDGSGGAVCNEGTLIVDRTTLCGNTARGGSGGTGGPGMGSPNDYRGYPGGAGGGANGAAICNLGSLWVTRSTFASNVVTGGTGGHGAAGLEYGSVGGSGGGGGKGGSGLGGALFNSGLASLANCTIASNTGSGGTGGAGGAGAWGGRSGGWGGSGGTGGSGFGGVDGTCNLTNCTVAWNLGNGGSGGTGGAAGSGPSPGAPGAPGTTGAAWGGTTCSTLVNSLIASNTPATNDSFTDPKLGPLANNGGPTLTMALLPGSPAIDAGNSSLAPATDQRGFPRPAGLAADIGAFEYGSVMPTIAISLSDTNGLNILASGNTGQTCRLLVSPDLKIWVPIATNQIGSDGTVLFYDDCAAGGICRFYRLVMP